MLRRGPCTLCGKQGDLTWHHLNYKNPKHVVSFCRTCHDILETNNFCYLHGNKVYWYYPRQLKMTEKSKRKWANKFRRVRKKILTKTNKIEHVLPLTYLIKMMEV